MSQKKALPIDDASRRSFLKSSILAAGGAAVVGGGLKMAQAAHSFGSDTIKIGLVGCGGRGTEATMQALNTQGGDLKVVALGDMFADRVQGSYRGLKGRYSDKIDVPQDRQFVGFDAYKQVLATDCDLVILATPPGFRPLHFAAAVDAGKHVFMEKPVAVDAGGVRSVLASAQKAKEKSLAVAVGLQRRHERKYMETVKALHDGAIGDIVLARAYWNGNKPWVRQRQKEWTELEYQLRNWYQFAWICGDHIVEQHIHNLDVINWVMNSYPTKAQGQGGAQHYIGKDYGEIFDHHFVEFTYGNGATCLSQCRHIPNCWDSVSEHVHGTKGFCDVSGSKIYSADGKVIHNFGDLGGGGHQQEHHDLFADLRAGRIPAEGEWGAKSSFTAILGRMATYSGKALNWDEALAKGTDLASVDWCGKLTSLNDEAPVKPKEDGFYRIPSPGETKVIG